MNELKTLSIITALSMVLMPALSITETDIRHKAGIEDKDNIQNIEKEIKEKTNQRIGQDVSQTSIKEEIREEVEQETKEIREGKEDTAGLFSAVLNLF